MTEVAINRCYGGFGLSEEALDKLAKIKGKKRIYDFDLDRTDSDMIKVIKELGIERSSGEWAAEIEIVKIPKDHFDNNTWSIDEYDGLESIKLDDEKLNLILKNKELIQRVAELESELAKLR